MRDEHEMLTLILDYARRDENIRAVVMNGSRVNPNARRDPFQDYDVVYLARDPAPLIHNPEIVRYFGEILILQTPEDMVEPPPENDGSYGYLMQFMDGTRIDLSILLLERWHECVADSLSRVLLDKDGMIPNLPPPSDRDYLPRRPTAKLFADCCNEFWWLNPYVAKGLWRGELTYAKYIFDGPLREQFTTMLTWFFGVHTDFRVSPGKAGKYLRAGLDPALWAEVERTYPDADFNRIWDALFLMGELFRRLALDVAQAFSFDYAVQDDRNVSTFVRRIRRLPGDATTI
jgi:aminoglycoside 6-adenylyltransferase